MSILNIFKAKTSQRALGDFGERAAAKFLKKNGYKIKRRGFAAAGAEIDIICETRDTVVYVEVKTRTVGKTTLEARPAAAVTPDKQKKILRASRFYHEGSFGKRQRFDIVEVYVTPGKPPRVARICHMPCAFDRDTAYRGLH